MDKTMRAAYVKVPYQVEIREVPVPDVADEWALVQVKACGICGTDMHITGVQANKWQGLGHEVAGIVVKAGKEIHHVKEGDTVALESGSFNPYTNISKDGRVDLDATGRNFWDNKTMGFADYILAPKEALVPYSPKDLDYKVACLAEPLGVAIDMTYTADIKLGNDVLVLGLGAIGLMSIPLARMQGAMRIYAVNRSGGKRAELAKAYGADEVILTQKTPFEKIKFRNGGVDRALVSASPRILPDVMKRMNYGGYVAFIGIEYGEGGKITFDANDFHFNKTQLRASHAAPALYFPTALQLLKDGHVDGDAIISHVLPLDKLEEGLHLMRDKREDVLKVVVTP